MWKTNTLLVHLFTPFTQRLCAINHLIVRLDPFWIVNCLSSWDDDLIHLTNVFVLPLAVHQRYCLCCSGILIRFTSELLANLEYYGIRRYQWTSLFCLKVVECLSIYTALEWWCFKNNELHSKRDPWISPAAHQRIFKQRFWVSRAKTH